MAYTVQLPDGRSVEFPDTVSKDEAARIIRAQLGVAVGGAPERRTGFGAALATGFENLIGSTTTAAQATFGDENKAAELALERAANSPYASQVSWDKVKEAYGSRGAVAAVGEILRQVPLAITEQLPQLAAALGGAKAGALAGTAAAPLLGPAAPAGPVIGGTLGALATIFPSLYGANIERQAAEQRARGEAVDVELGPAAGAAALQTGLEAAATFIPLGRRVARSVFGPQVDALLGQGKKEAAEALAKENLATVLAKGAAVGAATNVPTEVLQAVAERAQAGLPLLDDDALKEYGQNAYGGALVGTPLGAAGRAIDRAGARTEARAAEETAAAEQRRAAAQAEKAQRESPEYLLDLEKRYGDAVARMRELQEAVKQRPGKDADPAERAEHQQKIAELKAFTEDTMRPVTAEYVKRKAEIAQLKERQRVEGMTPFDYLLEQTQVSPIRGIAPGEAPLRTEADTEIFPAVSAPAPKAEYATSRIALANEQRYAEGMDPKDRAKVYAEYLMGSVPTARQLVAADEPIPGVSASVSRSVLAQLKLQLNAYDRARAERLKGAPIAQLEAEEAAALEDTARAEEARLAETEERKRLAPEITALQRMAARRLPESVREEPYIEAVAERAARAAPAPAPQPSAAVGQVQQLLTGQDVTYTAEEPKERQLRRVPGEGFKLFGESRSAAEAAPAKTPDTKLLRERINRALFNPDLSDAAYDLLRRAENLLPDVEVRLEALRTVQDPTRGTQQDIAQTAGLLELLDKQLTQIEQRQEGLPTAGRTLERQRRPITPGAADVVEPTFGTKDDIKLARQRNFADLVSQGFSPGEAAKRAFQIGKPTREAQEVPTDRLGVPVLPPERGREVPVTQRFAGRITPMQPREAREMAPGPVAERQPGRFLAQQPRKGTIRAQGAPLSLASEIEPLLDALERARAEDAGQQVLFPELEKERGTIASTPEAFRRRLERLKAVKDGYARELLRKEAAIEPLEQEIAQLEETLVVYQQQQKAFENAQFILNNNAALLKELRMTGAGTDALRGGMGALTLSEKNLKQVADAFARQRTLINAYLERIEREKTEAPKLKAANFNEIGQLLATQANDEARAKQALEFVQEELTRITRAEEDIYNRQFPQLDRAKETARAGMRDLHKRYGEASEWLNGLKELRAKIERQYETAQETQKQRTSDPEAIELVAELGQQLAAIDRRVDKNKALMDRLETQIAVAVAEAKIATLKAEASPEAIKRASDDLVAAKQRLRTLRAEVFKGQAKEVEAAAEPQADEATDYAENLKTHQRMLEAMQLRTESGTIVPALSYAQRLAREAGTAAGADVKFSVDDLALLDKDPKRVLNGLVSRATDLENKIRQAVARSRGAEFSSEKKIINRYRRLLSEYENAETALERSQLEPELSLALREYNDALNKSLNQRVVWKGQARDTAELLNTYKKIAYLEERFFLPQPAEKRAYRPETKEENAARKREAEAIFESQREAQAGAGETTGEALTRSQAAKRRKAQKTVYSGKGVGPEELSKKDAEDLLIAEGKQVSGQPLTAREQQLLSRQEKADKRIAENARIKEQAAKSALVRAAFEKKERKEQLTPLEQFLYDEAVSAGAKTAEDIDAISLEEAAAAETKPARGARTTEEAVDEETRAEVEKTFARQAGFESIELSRGATANPSTTDSVRTELRKAFPDLGRVQLYGSVEALVKANPQYEGRIPTDARGFVDTAGNKAFLIAENIDQGRALGVLLHEVGSHIGLKNMLGDAQYNGLVKAVETWAKKTDGSTEAKVAQAALARVEAAQTPASQRRDETLAYAIEEAVNAGVKPMETKSVLGQWLGRIAQLFRNALTRFGLPPKALDAQGLVDMAFGAAKMEMRGMRPESTIKKSVPTDDFVIGKRTAFLKGAKGEEPRAAVGLKQLTEEDDAYDDVGAATFITGMNVAERGKGLGTRLLNNLLAWADTNNERLALVPAAAPDRLLGGLSQQQLKDWYARNGFKTVGDYMVREPVATADEVLFSRKTTYTPGLADAGRVAEQLVGGQRSFLDKVKANLFGFRTQIVDMRASLEKVSFANMDELKATQLMYNMRMYDQRNHFVSEALATGVPERKEITRADGQKEFVIEAKPGMNIKQMVERLSTDAVAKEAGSPDAANQLFTLYTAAKRAERVGFQKLGFGRAAAEAELVQLNKELSSETLDPADRKRMIQRRDYLEKNAAKMPSEADIKAAVKQIEANKVLREAFEDVREMYNEYNRNLLEFAVQTGAIPDAEAKRLLAAKDYIPYYRVRGGNAELVIGGEQPMRIGNIKDSPQLEELVGGEEPIFDFLTSSVQNTSMLLDMSLRNMAVKNAMWELRDVGLAKLYPARNEKGGRRSVPENAVRFRNKGEDWFAIVDTDAAGVPSDLLVKGLAGMPTMLPAGVKMLAIPARILRRAIVANPVYMARQLFRDSVAATLASGANITPVLSSLKQIGKKNALDRRGITGGQVFTGMPEDMSRMLREMQTGRPGWSKAWSALERAGMEADAATRRAQYESYREQGLSEMEASYLALESMNFSKRGLSPTVHLANMLIPFFNAQIQGLDVLYRSLRGQMPFNKRLDIRNKLLTRGALLFVSSLAYAAAMQDEEEYKNARPDEKYGNWFVRMPFLDEYAEEPVVVRVPIPFELGYIFKALPEAIVNTMASEEGGKEALKALKQIVINTIPGGSSMPQIGGVPVPVPLPAGVKPAIELAMGRSFFTGRDIESMQEQQREPGERFRDNTSEAAKAIGQTFGISPIQLEYAIRGYTGGMGMALMQSLNFLMPEGEGAQAASRRMADLPLVGTLFQPIDAGGIIDATYTRMKEIQQVQRTYENMLETGRRADAERYAAEKADELSAASVAGQFRQVMGEITTFERNVRASPTLSPAEKREKLDLARQRKIEIAQRARALFDRRTLPASPA